MTPFVTLKKLEQLEKKFFCFIKVPPAAMKLCKIAAD